MRRGSLFTGIGMFEDGTAEVFGGRCVWFAESAGADAERAEELAASGGTYASIAEAMGIGERDAGTLLREARRSAWCRARLRERHPGAASLGDVCRIVAPASVDVVEVGFPCKDTSPAGSGAGLDGERSGLWHRVPSILAAAGARVVMIENASTLISRGLTTILRDLHALGFTAAAWQVIGAVGLGAPHIRERTIVIARKDGRLPVWLPLAPWARASLAEWWTPEREPPRTVASAASARERARRVDMVASLGNGVVGNWARYVATAARDAVAPVETLLGDLPGSGVDPVTGVIGPMPWRERLPPAGVMWRGKLYRARRVYSRSAARAIVEASPIGRLYGALLPTLLCADHRSGAGHHRTYSAPLREVVPRLMPTLTASTHTSNRGGAAGRTGPERLSLVGMARAGLLDAPGTVLPTLVASVATRGDSQAEQRRHSPHLGAQVAAMGRTLATLTETGNYNRVGASVRSGDGIATQIAEMTGGGLLSASWAAWWMHCRPELLGEREEMAA